MNVLQPQFRSLEIAEPPAVVRTLVGIDSEGLYATAIELLGRLKFLGNRLTLAHADSIVTFGGGPGAMVFDYNAATEIEESLRSAARLLLEEASARARHAGFGDELKTEYVVGHTAAALMDLAEKERTDLVAIGSRGHGAAECFFLGSVGRAFAIGGKQSFLVARGAPKTAGSVRAVFATDQSPYADSCFARLLDMDPKGLSHVTVVTALDPSKDNQFAATLGIDDRTPYTVTDSEQRMRMHGAQMVDRLAKKGIAADFRFIEGRTAEALREAMDETSSDLMIVGAKGHGLFDRMFIGSFALHAVVSEPYSVLVMRMPEGA